MPEETDLLDNVRTVTDAFARGDIDAAAAFYSDDAVFDMSSVGVGIFEGREAIRGLLEDWVGSYEDYEAVLEQLLDLGNDVTFHVTLHRGRLVGSSGVVELRHSYCVTWADGFVERVTVRPDIDNARADAERLAQERADG